MNPYQVLNVPTNASDHEIKAAYRKAVKLFHPDVSNGGDTETIVLINQAYELLSNPVRRNAYDMELNWIILPVEEDPREVYKREYLRKKREETLAKIARDKNVFGYLYKINIAIAVLALVLVVDEFLPPLVRSEIAINEWVLIRTVKHSTYRIKYYQTDNFTFAVPASARFEYDLSKPVPMQMKVSPVFRILTEVRIPKEDGDVQFEPSRTIYSFAIPFHYILFGFSVVTMLMKKYTPFSFSLGFAPLLILLLSILIFGYLS